MEPFELPYPDDPFDLEPRLQAQIPACSADKSRPDSEIAKSMRTRRRRRTSSRSKSSEILDVQRDWLAQQVMLAEENEEAMANTIQ